MKILETQSAHLTNYEVLQHLGSMRSRYAEAARERNVPVSLKSGNLETVMKELEDYLHKSPSPLAQPTDFTLTSVKDLFTALQPFDLTKAELLMILNLRPQSVGVLDTIVEEMESRFDDSEQERILAIVGEVLGRDNSDGAEDGGDNELAMDGIEDSNGNRHRT